MGTHDISNKTTSKPPVHKNNGLYDGLAKDGWKFSVFLPSFLLIICLCWFFIKMAAEAIMELRYRYRNRKRQARLPIGVMNLRHRFSRWALGAGSSSDATDSDLEMADHDVDSYRRYAWANRWFKALDIQQISKRQIKGGAHVRTLPEARIMLRNHRPEEVAILSWRWDFDHDVRSRNVAAAIRYSKDFGIRYLLLDILTVNQELEPGQLMTEIIEFSSLYKHLQVIAAYDRDLTDFQVTVRRPWIFHEMRLLAENKRRVVYVGHNQQGALISSSPFCIFFKYPLKHLIMETEFARQLLTTWRSNPVTSILHVLNGTNGMGNIHDFKYIIPELLDVCLLAERLSPNDYLLTIALLASYPDRSTSHIHRVKNRFSRLPYDNYDFDIQTTRNEYVARRDSFGDYPVMTTRMRRTETYRVYVGPVPVACFRYVDDNWSPRKNPTYTLEIMEDAWEAIRNMLNPPEEVYGPDALQPPTELSSFQVPQNVNGPDIDVVTVRV